MLTSDNAETLSTSLHFFSNEDVYKMNRLFGDYFPQQISIIRGFQKHDTNVRCPTDSRNVT